MKTRPTDEQIEAELVLLRELEPRIRPTSVFGDDNFAAIGAQIDVLSGRLSIDRVHEIYGEDAFIDPEEFDEYILESAVEAADWVAGDLAADMESPATGWKGLAS